MPSLRRASLPVSSGNRQGMKKYVVLDATSHRDDSINFVLQEANSSIKPFSAIESHHIATRSRIRAYLIEAKLLESGYRKPRQRWISARRMATLDMKGVFKKAL